MKKRFIVFSDLHITPTDYDAAILKEISQVIKTSKPDYIVCTGDLGEFASQNRLVKDRGLFSVADELTVVMNYLEGYIFGPIKKMQSFQRRMKRKLYKPTIVFCLGNHDAPVSEALTPMLRAEGAIVVQHRDYITLEDIMFSHTIDNGISGQACTTTLQILQNTLMRSVSGHSHVRSITEQRDSKGWKYFAIKMPCCTLNHPDWTIQGSQKWDRGYLCLTVDTDSDWYHYSFREFYNG